LATGCDCDAGFGGETCEFDLAKPESIMLTSGAGKQLIGAAALVVLALLV
jgi:hypothetical protein